MWDFSMGYKTLIIIMVILMMIMMISLVYMENNMIMVILN